MLNLKLSMAKGSFFRVLIGLAALTLFSYSAFSKPETDYNSLFFALLAMVMTWREHSLYLLKKKETTGSSSEE